MTTLGKKLEQLLEKAPILLSASQQQNLLAYIEQLKQWNKIHNLTAIREPEQMLIRHLLDSIAVAPFLCGKQFIDVGSGPGLPGIPLAIVKPEMHFTLLDSLGKRIAFLQHIYSTLKLPNITLVHSRVEKFTPHFKFDGILSRALAPLGKMLIWCQHLPSLKGHFYALKGARLHDEIAAIPPQFSVVNIITLQIPHLDEERYLAIIKRNLHS